MIAGWGTRLIDLLYPPRCAACRVPGAWLCGRCRAAVQPVPPPLCQRCGQTMDAAVCPHCATHLPEADGIRAAALFAGPIREAIHRLKYGNLTAVAPDLARLMAEAYRAAGWQADVVVPVPLHPARERRRGYNQAAALARPLAKELVLDCAVRGLRRTRATADQIGLDVQQRQANVAGAFVVTTPDAIAGRTVLVVDDVATTGYTLTACARAARQAGARAVFGLVVARRALDDERATVPKGSP